MEHIFVIFGAVTIFFWVGFIYYFRDIWKTRKYALLVSLFIIVAYLPNVYLRPESFSLLEIFFGFICVCLSLSMNLFIHYLLFKENWLNPPKYIDGVRERWLDSQKCITIHGERWTESELIESVDWARAQTWKKTLWSSTPSEDDYDHCEVCRWVLLDSDELEKNTGYINESRRWLCTECYENFVNKNSG